MGRKSPQNRGLRSPTPRSAWQRARRCRATTWSPRSAHRTPGADQMRRPRARWRYRRSTWTSVRARSDRAERRTAAAPRGAVPLTHSERTPMNKAELVSAIAKRADVSAATVDSVIDGLREELVEAITRGDKVALPGLLTVERSQRSARTGRNPQTGESIEIAASNTVKVTAGSVLKKAAAAVPVQ